jgi:hypothetical protein
MKTLLLRPLMLVAVLGLLPLGHPPLAAKRLVNQNAQTPLPQECKGADVDKLGSPLMVNVGNGFLLGLSVGTKPIVYGDRVPLYLWIVNQTDKPKYFRSCDIQWFMQEGFDVYDANEHRVPTIEERKNPQYRRPARSCLGSWMCDMNAILKSSAHSCTKIGTYDLKDLYAVTPGKYVVEVPLEIRECAARQVEESQPAEVPKGRLFISIEPK